MEVLMIAGLGNPGDEYSHTRHNAGLDFVNFQFSKYSLVPKKEKLILGSYAIKEFDDFKLIFLKPSTFMNESGKCISKAKKFFDDLNIDNLDIYFDPKFNLAKKFKMRGLPTTILIDKNGNEFARIIGEIDFDTKDFKKIIRKNS